MAEHSWTGSQQYAWWLLFEGECIYSKFWLGSRETNHALTPKAVSSSGTVGFIEKAINTKVEDQRWPWVLSKVSYFFKLIRLQRLEKLIMMSWGRPLGGVNWINNHWSIELVICKETQAFPSFLRDLNFVPYPPSPSPWLCLMNLKACLSLHHSGKITLLTLLP